MKKKLSKRACIKCPSSNALQPYLNEDGRIEGFCFSCNTNFYDLKMEFNKEYKKRSSITKEDVLSYPLRKENDRMICEEANARYGIRASFNERTNEVDTVYYPFYLEKVLSGFKVRVLPKDFESPSIGSIKNVDMFGWNLIDYRLDTIILTEGEEDAPSIAQVLWKYFKCKRWPNVVSLPNGGNLSKGLDKNLKQINKFKKIIACFDNDEVGKKTLTELSLKVDIKKLYVMELSEKDANDCLKAGKEAEIINAFLTPKQFRPEGIVYIQDLKELFYAKDTSIHIKYPPEWKQFNKITYGMRIPALDVFTSGTSNGKTQLFREIVIHLLKSTEYRLGALFLEESSKDTLDGLGGLLLNKRMHLPDVQVNLKKQEMDRTWEELSKGNRIVLRKTEWNKIENNSVLSNIRYMAEAADCKFIFLDHLSIVVSSDADKGQERERIDTLMTKLKCLAMELNIWIGVIVHLRKSVNHGIPFERGGVATGEDLRGSKGIEQLSNSVYFFQRNRTHSVEEMRNIVRLWVLKNRFEGSCGGMDYLRYDRETGRMLAVPEPGHPIMEKEIKNSNPNVEEDF